MKTQTIPVGVTSKICTRCKKPKSIDDFYKNKSGTWGIEARCKQCAKDHYAEIRNAGIVDGVDRTSPARRCHLLRKYGMTLEEYLERLEKQNNRCAICRKPETMQKRGLLCNLSVDHDHDTNKNRDLLCDRCNSLLGNANDNISILQTAIEYLRRHADGRDNRFSGNDVRSDSTSAGVFAG